jgi:hypothetical protein
MNKTFLGLHAWGNVVPCCQACNNEKQQKPWREFLLSKADDPQVEKRSNLIQSFVSDKNYDPELNLYTAHFKTRTF